MVDRIYEMSLKYGTPMYIYDGHQIDRNYEILKSTTDEEVDIFYSIKANPNGSICRQFHRLGAGIEVASGGELQMALHAGFEPKDIIFAGPGKNEQDLELAIKSNIYCITVESLDEIKCIDSISRDHNRVTRIGLRISPRFKSLENHQTQFGIDEMDLDEAFDILKQSAHVQLIGTHVFARGQVLDTDLLMNHFKEVGELVLRISAQHQFVPEFVNLGGGFGVPYFEKQQPLDMEKLGSVIAQVARQMKTHFSDRCRVAIESGRFLVAQSGYFVTKVLYKKRVKNKRYLIVDGGFNHNSFATFRGRVSVNNYPIDIIMQRDHSEQKDRFDIAGPLCTPADLFGINVELPADVSPGDLLYISYAGAYGLTFSPVWFLGHNLPAEVYLYDNQVVVNKGRTYDEWINARHDLKEITI